MLNLIQQTKNVFSEIKSQLLKSNWGTAYYSEFEKLFLSLDEPCTVAIVGQVSAGKSTFVNALVGNDYAKVGAKETTAILTYFKYGFDECIKCFWHNESITIEPISFLDTIQGYSKKTLEKVSKISHIEIYINNPMLDGITIVDTPGTDSIVEEHTYRSENIIKFHNEQTEKLHQEATAIIYLIGSVNATTEHKKYLDVFRTISSGISRPMNSLGVMSKIDLSTEALSSPQKFSKKIYEQLKGELNSVIPVSAAFYSLVNNNKEKIKQLQIDLQKIPKHLHSILFSSFEAFKEFEIEDCPLSPKYRSEMTNILPNKNWAGFYNLAKILLNEPLGEAIAKIRHLSGMDELFRILKLHFFDRAKLLVSYKAIHSALNIFSIIEEDLISLQKKETSEIQNKILFIEFLKGFSLPIAKELIDFIYKVYDSNYFDIRSIEFIQHFRKELTLLQDQLNLVNQDFYARNSLLESRNDFNEREYNELNILFGSLGYDYNSVLAEMKIQNQEEIMTKYSEWKYLEDNSKFGTTKKELSAIALNRLSKLFSVFSNIKP